MKKEGYIIIDKEDILKVLNEHKLCPSKIGLEDYGKLDCLYEEVHSNCEYCRKESLKNFNKEDVNKEEFKRYYYKGDDN